MFFYNLLFLYYNSIFLACQFFTLLWVWFMGGMLCMEEEVCTVYIIKYLLGKMGLCCLYYKVLIREDRFVGTIYMRSTIYARIVLVI